jgi:hypothetical protein
MICPIAHLLEFHGTPSPLLGRLLSSGADCYDYSEGFNQFKHGTCADVQADFNRTYVHAFTTGVHLHAHPSARTP